MANEETLRDYLKWVTADLHQARERIRDLEAGQREPIAVVAMSCRYPGDVATPEDLWEIVAEGRDAVSQFPANRGWDVDALYDPDPERPGSSYTREGGFLHDADLFDPAFFGISPREALAMDPQQRLLLETTWEAFERAGVTPRSLHGSRTGVFVGSNGQDYGALFAGGAENLEGHLVTGTAAAVISGRLSYTFGLEGPAVTVDTACSSSLVALHLAIQSLRRGECDLALAGGVTIMATPAAFTEFSKQRGLAADGRCKAFAGAADGTGWGEGVGLLLVERLSDARRLGHPVLAVVRGSAVNQDGASNGLTAPNGPSQQRVILEALSDAGLTTDDVDVVEAHGTGTTLGDPIEAQALLATYGQGRAADRPLLLGSVKSNIGHTQAASGVAGIIKMVLAMRNGLLPRTLHVDEPSPHVDWSVGAVKLLTDAVEWPETGHPRRSAVSSFGMSGTNAHIVLEQVTAEEAAENDGTQQPADGAATEPADVPEPAAPKPFTGANIVSWIVSARGQDALASQAQRLAQCAADTGLDVAAAGAELLRGRTLFEDRAVVLGVGRDDLVSGLTALAEGREADGLISGTATGTGSGPVFVFPGQGSQWVGMATDLMATSPAFRESIEACERALAPFVDWSLTAVLSGDGAEFERVDIVQPVLFAVMVSLAAVWRSLGVEPAAVVGHSQGEIAAACVAGALSLDDAARVVALRSKEIARIAGTGGMVSLFASREQAEELLQGFDGRVGIAAVNGPGSVVVSGLAAALDEFVALCGERGVDARRVNVDYASHSAQMEDLKDEVLEALAPIVPGAPVIPMFSTYTASWVQPGQLGASYWYENLRHPVRMYEAVEALAQAGHRIFIESSPHPVLTVGVQDALDENGGGIALGTLRRDRGDAHRLLTSAAQAFVNGATVDWTVLFADVPAEVRPELPTYAFQHRRYWPRVTAAHAGDVTTIGLGSADHPLLGAAVALADGDGLLFTGRLSAQTHPWIADHALGERVLLPGTAFVELAVHAGSRVGCDRLDELTLEAPLFFPANGAVTLQVWVGAAETEGGRRPVTVYSRAADADGDAEQEPWTRHATGFVAASATAATPATGLETWPPAQAEAADAAAVYDALDSRGYGYGPAFRGLRAVWRSGDEIFAEVALAEPETADATQYGLHPALLDASLHALALLTQDSGTAGEAGGSADAARPRMPFAWEGVRLHAIGATALRVRLTPTGPDTLSVVAADSTGAAVATVDALTLRPAPIDAAAADRAAQRDQLFRIDWTALPSASAQQESSASYALISAATSTDITAALNSHQVTTYPDLAALVEALGAEGATAPDAVILPIDALATSGSESDVLAATHELTAAALNFLQNWLVQESVGATRLVIVTQDAIAARPGDTVTGLSAAAVWGLLRTAQSEHPGRFAVIDLDDTQTSRDALSAAIASAEPQIALRDGEILLPRLARRAAATTTDAAESEQSWDPAGTVLIIGGTGILGGIVARHLAAQHGISHLILTGRRGAQTPGADELLADLTGLGATTEIVACDAADRAALAAVIEGVDPAFPLRGVVHAAGILDDAVLDAITGDQLAASLRSKADVAWNLHELTDGLDLTAFVLFSSFSGVAGSPGQAAYAAGNAFVDALAARRAVAVSESGDARRRPALSLAWGFWDRASGMTGHLGEAELARMARRGVLPLTTEQGLALLDTAVAASSNAAGNAVHDDAAAPDALVVPVRLDVSALRRVAAAGDLPALYQGLVRGVARRAANAAGAESASAGRFAVLPAEERAQALLDLVRAEAATVLGYGADGSVDPARAFKDLGFDSLMAVELRNRLTRATGVRLPATLVFDYPNPRALAEQLAAKITGQPAAAAPTAIARAANADEPVAIIGMSCRFPGGVRSPEDLWQLVATGTDAVGIWPDDRGWDIEELFDPEPGRAGRSYSREGGFLYEAGEFDAGFFGISPREALAMDPQQRLLLETAWEAFERAGIDPAAVRGSRTGVFAGVMYHDYASRLFGADPEDLEDVQGYLGNGSAGSVASGRISYTLGLEGPAVTVDTACSSSLVALHLAAQALRNGECTLALAGGVTVMSTPGIFIDFSRQRAMAADGRCKPFAAAADGTGWGEGVGMLLVERLSDAKRLGHPIMAVVRGSAVNQDGASNGLTAPNGPSQQRVILAALGSARLTPDQVDVVEGHGTGTTLGDPIEAQALLATYGQDRGEHGNPLLLGSIKSNIGHAQAASGVAGVIKMVMAMRSGEVPRSLHVDEPSPHVDWTAGAVELLKDPVGWPETGRPRRAGVSSFGVSGTNAHVILEQSPAQLPARRKSSDGLVAGRAFEQQTVTPWILSARGSRALAGQAVQLAEFASTADTQLDVASVAAGLLHSRSLFEDRAVALGTDRDELISGLSAFAQGQDADGVIAGTAAYAGSGVVFVFPGQGSQWVGMASGLMVSSPVFWESIEACERALEPFVDWSLTAVLSGDGAEFERVDIVQPVLFAVMVSLAAVWRALGVEPAAVVGHSQGEIAAACVAGALTLEDAARVVALRSKEIARIAGTGGMVSLFAGRERAEELLQGFEGRVGIAAVNGPGSVVVSGLAAALDEFVALCGERGVDARRVNVDYASHSAQMEDLKNEVLEALAPIVPAAPQIPMFSAYTASWVQPGQLDATYWYENLRHPVRLYDAVRELARAGHRVFIESSPHPVLTVGVQDTLDETGGGIALGTLRRDHGTTHRFLTSAAQAFVNGATVAWDRILTSAPAPAHVDLPTYAFQRDHYWLDGAVRSATGAAADDAGETVDAAFWDAVENNDLGALAETLGVDGDRPISELLPVLSDWRRGRREASILESWRYTVTWRPADLKGAARSAPTGRWLVVSGPDAAIDPAADECAAALEARGAEVVRLTVPADEDGTRESYAQLLAEAGQIDGIVATLGLDPAASTAGPALTRGLSNTLTLIQAHGDVPTAAPAPLWLVTRGGVSVGRSDGLADPGTAQIWGLGRVAALEHPDRWGGLIDLPATLDARAADRLCAALAGLPGREDQIAVRGTGVYVRRLERAPLAGRAPVRDWTPRGTVLVTGASGTLAPHMVRWLVSAGAQHLVLLSRRGPDAPGADDLRALGDEAGIRLDIEACDVADRDQLAGIVARLAADGTPVTSVLHAAASIRLLPIETLTPAQLESDLAAKVLGARNLHEIFAEDTLDAFVLFSSIAGVWGSGIHAAYAAGNTYVDTLAEQRRAAGLTATSIAWGVWAAVNIYNEQLVPEGVDPERLQRQGLPFLDPETAFSAMKSVLDHDETFIAVADVAWDRFTPSFTSARPRPLLEGIPEARVILARAQAAEETTQSGTVHDSEFAARLAGLSAADQDELLLELVRSHAAAVLKHASAEAIEPARAFRDCGFDSLTAVELRDRLAKAAGIRLPATIVFDFPNPTALAARLRELILGARSGGASADAVRTLTRSGSAAADEPIAIVGMACRYAGGVESPEDLWDLLAAGRDAVGGFPADRGWDLDALYDPDPDQRGTSYTREGGFLTGAGSFDPGFFGISPREAIAIDPQQRLLLTATWEAFERAGIDPHTLRGEQVGIFAGVNGQDYGVLLANAVQGNGEGYLATGNSVSVVSGRIAYALGLQGPAVTVDTACSSSLVALHLAAQALRAGECTMALAGGVTVMSTPAALITFSRQRGLATDGRCKAFSAAADGMGMAEGVGMLLVERLSDAQRLGHPVLAVMRGSAVNQDGASNGLTAPNGPAQQRVILQALANAGLNPGDVDAVEAHGTGTSLGDPIEAQALLATYGQDRGHHGNPLLLGSIKSNIGHTQAAAGVAGVIKVVLSLRNGLLPQTLHVTEPTGEVDWTEGAVGLLTEAAPWPETGRPRRAGVSSFGISGTNVHLLLEQAPETAGADEGTGAGGADAAAALPLVPWVLAGRGERALAAQAARLSSWLDGPGVGSGVVDVGCSLVRGRSTFEHRGVVIAADRDGLAAGVLALAAGDEVPSVLRGVAGTGKSAVLMSGQGSQRCGAGRELYAAFPVFADALDEACAHFDPELDRPLRDVLLDPGSDLLDQTQYTQTGLFALEVALYRLAESWGVRPELLAGHSIGELAAAYVAGVWSLEDACRLVAARGRLMQALPSGGAMLAVQSTEDEVREALAGLEAKVSIAAINGPTSIVVSGVTSAVDKLAKKWRGEGRKVKKLTVSHAFHSPLMEPMLAEFRAVAESLTYDAPVIPIVSNVTGEIATADQLCDPEYWVRHVREAVRFADGISTLYGRGVRTFLELGPDGVLAAMARDALAEAADAIHAAPVLRSGRGEAETLFAGLATGYVHGMRVDWDAVYAGTGARRVDLPTYAFQEERYWVEVASALAGDVTALGLASAEHPLLGATVTLADGDGLLFTTRLSAKAQPWLADHAVLGAVLVPGTAFIELGLQAAAHLGAARVDDLTLEAPLVLPERGGVDVQVRVGAPDADGRAQFTVHASAADPATAGVFSTERIWTRHASGFLASAAVENTDSAGAPDLATWPPADATVVDISDFYPALQARGYAYGPVFQGLRAVWKRGSEIFAEVALPDGTATDAAAYAVHPALLDAALHPVGLGDFLGAPGDGHLPFAWSGVRLHAGGARSLRIRLAAAGTDAVRVDAADVTGQPVLSVEALVLRPVNADQLAESRDPAADSLFRLEWVPMDLGDAAAESIALLAGTESQASDTDAAATALGVSALASLDEIAAAGDVPAAVLAPVGGNGATRHALELVKTWLADERFAEARLVVLTNGAVCATTGGLDTPDPDGAAVWGLIRSAQSENPGRVTLIDIDGAEQSWQHLPHAVASGAWQLALRSGVAHTPRLARARAADALTIPADTSAWRLDSTERGTLDTLTLIADPEADRRPGADEVRIAVRAAGLNFRDVLSALGMYPGQAPMLGGEGAGVVLEVGAEVTGLAAGDRVLGMFPGAFGPVAVADGRMLARVPDGWSFAQAASVPIVFLTALYAWKDLANLRAGQRVLIHSGAGGVGMAAIQLAKHLGAEVFATASPGKWDTLRSLGLDDAHIANSRDTEFAVKFLAETGGEGVDVVLNSLAREFVDASLELLPRGGRFLEMGKTDIRDAAALPDGVEYRAFDLVEAGPARIGELLGEILALFAGGALDLPPVRTWDVRRAREAFRFVSQAKHIGKVVLTIPRPLDPQGTVLVTGGTGSLGALVARHLVTEHGIRNLVLTSRSGLNAAGAPELVCELEELGASVKVEACDVADREALTGLLGGIQADRPLTAVVHTAGVLADSVVETMTADQLAAVWAPKAGAAWHLDELTGGLDLAAFVLFSSASSIFGGAGQANYAAANAYLDALAAARHADGLPATSLAWGLWAQDGGMTGHLAAADLERMARSGVAALSPEQGLALFDAALGREEPALVPLRLEPAALQKQAAAGELPPLFDGLVRTRVPRAAAAADDGKSAGDAARDFQERIGALTGADRERALLDLVQAHTALVLGHATPAGIEPGRGFLELGLDSLSAVELRNRLGAVVGRRLPATLVFDYPSPAALARHLGEHLPSGERSPVPSVHAELDRLEALLAGVTPGEDGAGKITARLRRVLSAWNDQQGPVSEQDAGRLDSVTADELFDLLDTELGTA